MFRPVAEATGLPYGLSEESIWTTIQSKKIATPFGLAMTENAWVGLLEKLRAGLRQRELFHMNRRIPWNLRAIG